MRDLGSLALLDGKEDEWLAPAAGIPLFPSLWGRDNLTAVWQASAYDHGEMANSILFRLGRLQGQRDDAWHDEQPGRIIRSAERGPLARLGITPFGRYYADYASLFDFIFALGQIAAWSGDNQRLRKHWDAALRIIEWAQRYGDLDGDGYLEYKTRSPAGPKHQGWKDSENAIVYEDGRQASPPIAPCEIQGYFFAALQLMSGLSLLMREPANALAFWKAAARLKEKFNRDFWMEDAGCWDSTRRSGRFEA